MKNKYNPLDIILYPAVIAAGFFIRLIPVALSFFIAKGFGRLAYIFYAKRRSIGYTNIKAAFPGRFKPNQIKKITLLTFQHFAQVLFELFKFPSIDEKYIERYVRCDGLSNVDNAVKRGHGAIILTAHFGNWEFSGLAGAVKGYPQDVLAKQQKFILLNGLLNKYRERYGRRVIEKGMATRGIINALKENRIVAILSDQDGGASGVLVDFFGRLASTPKGAVVFALKFNSEILPNFCARIKGPFYDMTIEKPIALQNSGDIERDAQENLQKFTNILEDYINRFPSQWLWLHKRWKTTPSRRILILTDAKAGHLNQALAVAKQVKKAVFEKAEADDRVKALKASLRVPNLRPEATSLPQGDCFVVPPLRVGTPRNDVVDDLIYQEKTIEVKYRSGMHKIILAFCSLFASSRCQGCLRCLKLCLKKDSYENLSSVYADIIISCGSKAAFVNRFLCKENRAKGIVIMKPAVLPEKNFDLCIIPRHDNPRRLKNVVVTEGALNLMRPQPAGNAIGLLIGGDNKNFMLSKSDIADVLAAAIKISKKTQAPLLVTTSRRTSAGLEMLIKEKIGAFDGCKMLVIANEKNPPDTVNKILNLSGTVIVSGESISMVSEAASSGKRVLVFQPQAKRQDFLAWPWQAKHMQFLKNLQAESFIILCKPQMIEEAFYDKRPLCRLDDNNLVYEAVKKLI